ncbi:MAG: PIN domain-containing protein [Planctomycetales bacterium]
MNFAAIPYGASVFLDANVFVYSLTDDATFGDPCTELLERVEFGDLQGFISVALFSDVAHRLMTLEACETNGWPYAGIGNRLRRNPVEIQKLHRFRQALDEIVSMGIRILPVQASQVLHAADLSRQHGLLSGDALIVAIMLDHGLTLLASNDADFDRVPGLMRYAPVG